MSKFIGSTLGLRLILIALIIISLVGASQTISYLSQSPTNLVAAVLSTIAATFEMFANAFRGEPDAIKGSAGLIVCTGSLIALPFVLVMLWINKNVTGR